MSLFDIIFLSLLGIALIISFINILKDEELKDLFRDLFNWERRFCYELGINLENWEKLNIQEKEIFKRIYYTGKGKLVKFHISNDEKITYPDSSGGISEVAGYFSGDEHINGPNFGLAIGGNKEDWFFVLLHESCHMDQWLEKSIFWRRGQLMGIEVYSIVDDWINGKEFKDWEIDKAIKSCIDIELDCEKRVIEKMKKFELGYDLEEYIQKSNSYVLFYGAIRKLRKWYDNAPYKNKEVWGQMPNYFLNSEEYFNIDNDKLELYKSLCVKQ